MTGERILSPVSFSTTPARTKAEAIITRPRALCQIWAQAASTFLGSPAALR